MWCPVGNEDKVNKGFWDVLDLSGEDLQFELSDYSKR